MNWTPFAKHAAASVLLFSLVLFSTAQAQSGPAEPAAGPTPVSAVIDASKTMVPISPYIYGQFLEHIGGIVNHGLWAEMLDDRKFYNPIVTEIPAPPKNDRFANAALRRWLFVGPAEAVTFDTVHPYAGDHTPVITLDPSEKHGVIQSGLSVQKGKSYSGHVILDGSGDARVTLTLIWGPAPAQRQSIELKSLSSAPRRFSLNYTAQADSATAQFEIAATGAGRVRLDAVSLMPADNLEGFRPEVIAALKRLHSGVYRFPGGNFVSAHEWRDAIGDPDRRPPILDPVWKSVQPNDVGTDEFLTLCRLLEVEPYITVSAGFGDAYSAAQYVEYCNGAATTPMGRQRAANGHPQPYHVKFWGVGNEAWGSWQYGAMALDQFVYKHNQFAKAMLRVDPSIKLIASGAMPDAMTGSKESKRLTGKEIPDFLSAADWTGGMFTHCLDNMDLISEHFYSYNKTHFDLTKGEQVPDDPNEPLVDWMRRPANHVRSKYEADQNYLARIPALKAKAVPIALDEWAYSGLPSNDYKLVPAYAWTFHEMFRDSSLYQMACFTFATSLLSADNHHAELNPAGLMFELYRNHFGTLPVEVSGNSPQPAPKYPPGGEEPAVNAGSPTFPLDVVAAWTADRRRFTVAVINPTETVQTLHWTINGAELKGTGTLRRMAPANIHAKILVGQDPEVKVEEQQLDTIPSAPSFAPFSVNLYEFAVK